MMSAELSQRDEAESLSKNESLLDGSEKRSLTTGRGEYRGVPRSP